MFGRVVVFGCLMGLVLSVSYVASGTATCVSRIGTTGPCNKWIFNSSMLFMGPKYACFPGNAKMRTQEGLRSMEELRRGDRVLGYQNGEEVYTQITSWFHKLRDEEFQYLNVSISEGHFYASAKHNLALENLEYKFTEEIGLQKLFKMGEIKSRQKVIMKGVFAPKTVSNNYFIYLSQDEEKKILAHCYSNIRNPDKIDYIIDFAQALWNLLDGRSYSVHPVHILMERYLGPYFLE